MTEPTAVEDLSWADAIAELDAILDRLEHDEPDVDRVATDVARASALVTHCRDRITSARLRVDEVVGAMAPLDPTASSPDDESDEADDTDA